MYKYLQVFYPVQGSYKMFSLRKEVKDNL